MAKTLTKKRTVVVLQLVGRQLMKTRAFRPTWYLGDPINAARIFSEMDVDELLIVDISGALKYDKKFLGDLFSECLVPTTYAGNVRTLEEAEAILASGCEKICISSGFHDNPELAGSIASRFGSQSLMIGIEYHEIREARRCAVGRGDVAARWQTPSQMLKAAVDAGAGEVLLSSITRDGAMDGFDVSWLEKLPPGISVPVISQGGGGSHMDITQLFEKTTVSACAIGSLAVFADRYRGILLNYPERLGRKA